jgi:hypothetical protein
MRRALMVPLVLAVSLLAPAAAAAPPDAEARRAVVEAEALLEAGRGREALSILSQLVTRLGQTNPRLQADLVRAAAAAGDPTRTLAEHRVWLSLHVADADTNAELEALRASAERQQAKAEREAAERRRSAAEELRAAERALQLARERDELRRTSALADAEEAVRQGIAAESRSQVESAIGAVERVRARYPGDAASLEEGLSRLRSRRDTLLAKELDRQDAAEKRAAARARSAAKVDYVKGSLLLAGGAGLAAVSVWMIAKKPIEIPSYPIGAVGLGVGGGMIIGGALHLSRGASRSASLAPVLVACPLPGGALLGVSGAL